MNKMLDELDTILILDWNISKTPCRMNIHGIYIRSQGRHGWQGPQGFGLA